MNERGLAEIIIPAFFEVTNTEQLLGCTQLAGDCRDPPFNCLFLQLFPQQNPRFAE
jgi:hypothetical protein